ncbi:MAG: 6,7-dimethyl-8-ribityllumazine synthase [Alphaproteobacteria bacterium]|nr:6,7-dimethyl-8-ribityllumazine synthase [Alphaproteobacteria bacterium]MBF0249053.1 6,7-dimethyl-8-ribityllumazine synthase [Alphaproteobacteria bacterium]
MAHKVLIIEAPFYQHITDELVKGATAKLDADGVDYDRVSVPGAFEIPGVIALSEEAMEEHPVAATRYDGYVALGCVIRGETTHYDYVAGESCRALMELTLDGVAIGNGILTVENEAQALVRAGVDKKNKGADAAEACVRMIEVRKSLMHGNLA